jgi:multiple sugar transport system substrate-binding protein
MKPRRARFTMTAFAASLLLTAPIAAACGTSPGSASGGGTQTLTVAYSNDLVFDTTALAADWVKEATAAFKAKYPKDKIVWEALPGNYQDVINKLSLLYRSPSTAPDVAEVPDTEVGLWASSGYLLSLNDYLNKASWWSDFPKPVQEDGEVNGVHWAVDEGENVASLLYNKTMLEKAGIKMPWQPTTWSDVIQTAKKVKAANPGVVAFWLNAGTSSGADGVRYGIQNFIDGTTTPTIQATGDKMVVNSPGLRAALTFYQQAFAAGIGPTTSEDFSPNAVTNTPTLMADGKVAIALTENWLPGAWTKTISAPYWPQAREVVGNAYLPTNYDGTRPAGVLSGWELDIYSKAANPQLAFDFINLVQGEKLAVDFADFCGYVPPETSYGSNPTYLAFAPFGKFYSSLLPYSVLTPLGANFPAWVQGIGEATGAFVQNPNTSVSKALSILSGYVSSAIGPSNVMTVP